MAKSRANSKKDQDILEITEKPPNYKREEEITEDQALLATIEDYIFFKDEDKLVKLELNKIVLLEAMSNYINVYYFTEHFELVEITREKDDDDDDYDYDDNNKNKKDKDGMIRALRMNTIR
ncbi:MAG: hypothetical protein J7497_02300, partial [Chitinophagaceae bacterium]|nr:hypothetical protein [Chitinophagaceae bacterium]